MKRLLFFTALAAAACFDPLYEDGAPLTSSWVVCCSNFGEVGTCFCKEAATCQQSLYACSAGRCSPTPFCPMGTGGGSKVWIDKTTRTIRVGPQSAGAAPGPGHSDRATAGAGAGAAGNGGKKDEDVIDAEFEVKE